jgi:hypothetical protein
MNFRAKPIHKGIARLFAILSPEPVRVPSNQTAHHDAVGVTLAGRDLVDTDGFQSWPTPAGELRAFELLPRPLDRFPVAVGFLGIILAGGFQPCLNPSFTHATS